MLFEIFLQLNLNVLVENNIKFNRSGHGFDIVDGKLPLGESVQLLVCCKALENPKVNEACFFVR